MRMLLILTTIATSPLVTAQSLTGALTAPVTLQASYSGQSQVTTVPTGPLGAGGFQQSVAPGAVGEFASATLQWSIANTSSMLQFRLQQNCAIAGVTPANATIGACDVLLSVQAPAATAARVLLHRQLSIGGGMVVPPLTIDIGDDGSTEYVGIGSVSVPAQLGPAGVPIRVRTQADLTIEGSLFADVFVQVVPADMTVTSVGGGCLPGDMTVEAGFDGSVTLRKTNNLPFHLAWAPVIGLSIQPIVVPGWSPLCVLLPSPDVVLFAGTSSTYGFPVPASVRPLTFWSQSVLLTPVGLSTGAPFQIDAH